MTNSKEAFSAGEAARITGVPYRTLDHWARTRFIVPSVSEASGTGTERKYDFNDLIALRVARDLRTAGISTQALRAVVHRLREEKGLRNPLAELRLVAVGADVHLVTSCKEITSLLKRPAQQAFAFVLDVSRTVSEIKQDLKAAKAAESHQAQSTKRRATA
jgi:DNA-binding transcriptional MerR regulator